MTENSLILAYRCNVDNDPYQIDIYGEDLFIHYYTSYKYFPILRGKYLIISIYVLGPVVSITHTKKKLKTCYLFWIRLLFCGTSSSVADDISVFSKASASFDSTLENCSKEKEGNKQKK